MYKIILASKSPRRKEILSSLGLKFEVTDSGFDESSVTEKDPIKLCKLIAENKAKKTAEFLTRQNLADKEFLILAADTLIFNEKDIFGKPKNSEEAEKMLRTFSGTYHTVITAIYIIDFAARKTYENHSLSNVFFKKLSDKEISVYLKTMEWQDAAGGYKIQEKAGLFIEKIEGSHSGIIGLPINLLYCMLKEAGLDIL